MKFDHQPRHPGYRLNSDPGAGIGDDILLEGTLGLVDSKSVFRGGIRYFDLQIKAEKQRLNGELEFDYWGPALFLVASF
jgi:hypothetical protein